MARTFADSSQLPRPVVLSSVSLLAQHIPLALVQKAIAEHGRANQRDRLLPAPFLVYLIVALSLYMPFALREVLRCVTEGMRFLGTPAHIAPTLATKGAISRARSRLGWEVMKTLCSQVTVPLATPTTRGAWYRGLRLVALDGTTLAVPATPHNIAAFGLPAGQNGAGAFPLVQLAALVEVGTHVIFRVAFDAGSVSEKELAMQLLPELGSGMLLLEDRGFVGYHWWKQVRETKAEIICRLRNNMKFPVVTPLADGSYLSVLPPPQGAKDQPIIVRVIRYSLPGVPGTETEYRIITSLLNPDDAPAREVAALYHERWEAETTFDEFKTHLRGGALVILRSKTPDLVQQEIYGLLLAHFVVRSVMHAAALQADEDPDRISFIHTIRVLRRKLPQAAGIFSPEEAEAVDAHDY
jgi:hypothetical protein